MARPRSRSIVTITGTNDAATISGTAAGRGEGRRHADGSAGTLTVADVDSGEAHFQTPASLTATYGVFTFDPSTGVWSYTLNNAAADVQSLTGGQVVHDTLTVKSADGTASQQIDVTITGTNDTASITGTATGAVKDGGMARTGDRASGTLTVADVDSGEAHFQTPASLTATYGVFTFDPSTGAWSYTLTNAAANVQSLDRRPGRARHADGEVGRWHGLAADRRHHHRHQRRGGDHRQVERHCGARPAGSTMARRVRRPRPAR